LDLYTPPIQLTRDQLFPPLRLLSAFSSLVTSIHSPTISLGCVAPLQLRRLDLAHNISPPSAILLRHPWQTYIVMMLFSFPLTVRQFSRPKLRPELPSVGRSPTIVKLMTRSVGNFDLKTDIESNSDSPVPCSPHHGTYGNSTSRVPHPEVHMDYVYLVPGIQLPR